ncbi:MAG: prolyl oligopeptidase family serine peptidase, partial [Candidatus Poribacteria bacterium]|nr:prolyl oligopeptidase family serine peptidase [Candidatus Poribacteria bacterium]
EKTDTASLERWEETCKDAKTYFWDDVIGRCPSPDVPANPRTRLIYDEPRWKGYEVVLDVWEGVFAYGILLLPNDLQPGEQRPVVVCQHGLEGRPQDTADPKIESVYYSYAAQLADRGFITYAPQNPYIGQDAFRVIQRKANPIKWSLFSLIIRQHERTLDWLAELPFVDADRLGFYGLSYGGKTAMRVPAVLDRYACSICSADFNEWIVKNATYDSRYSYMFTGEYEMPEFDLGNTFNYGEMAGLIAPRPFMVERGHDDGVAPDEWVAHEFAVVRRLYVRLGIADRTEIEFFDGGHQINSDGTFSFLHRHLNWPESPSK